jgi:hypothetical protein
MPYGKGGNHYLLGSGEDGDLVLVQQRNGRLYGNRVQDTELLLHYHFGMSIVPTEYDNLLSRLGEDGLGITVLEVHN